MSGYIIDSNFWISAGNYYPVDLFPSFWDRMEMLIGSGEAIIHQTVLEEIDRREDFVSRWLHGIQGYVSMPISEDALEMYVKCCQWAEDEHHGYTLSAIAEFEQNSRADAWICAEAIASGLGIVTAGGKSNSINKVKIPNVCDAFGVEYVSNLDFMRLKGFRF